MGGIFSQPGTGDLGVPPQLGTGLQHQPWGAPGAAIGHNPWDPAAALFDPNAPTPNPESYDKLIIQQLRQAYMQQQQLAQQLQAQALGQGPSVAGIQLGQGLEQINRGQASQAAGVGGEGGVLARYSAMNNAAQAGAAENQSAALARATEIANAQQNLGNVLGNENATGASVYGTNISGGNAAAANAIGKTKNEEEFGTKVAGAAASGIASGGASSALGDGLGYTPGKV
jgi:hypothetical protein